ncbi:MAG: S-layer homology domain-containing protein [Polyangiaceae bacterium]
MKQRTPWILLTMAPLLGCGDVASDLVDTEPETSEAADEVTVGQASATSCSTSAVSGLSAQIIAEGNCIAPGAYASLPSRPNLVVAGGAVNLRMQQPARDALVAALDTYPATTLAVTSMLRTPAQQLLLYEWYLDGVCGIGLAAPPGASNHETGLAIDTSSYGAWINRLGSFGFAWLGSADPVHFDYVGAGAVDDKSLGVLAFQRLWNRNRPGDAIAEDGSFGNQTRARMLAAPAEGFPVGAVCGDDCQAVFSDICQSPFRADIEWLAAQGITSGCGNGQFCPADLVTREQMAGFLATALGLPPSNQDFFVDDDASVFEGSIDAIAAAGITSGCAQAPPRFCPETTVTRGQMAAFLANALNLAPANADTFVDDDGSPFEAAIEAIYAAGITSGCAANPPRFCPNQSLTREQMASFLRRAFDV